MSRRLRPAPLLGLTVIWVMLWGTFTLPTVVYGLLVAALVLLLFPLPALMSTLRVHPVGFAVLVGRFLVDLVGASTGVAALALRPRPIGPGSIIDVTLRLPDDLRRTIVAEFTSLVPGTVVIDLDASTGVLTLHVLDTTDPERLAAERAKVHALEDRVEAAFEVSRRHARVDDDSHDPLGTSRHPRAHEEDE